MKSYRDWPISKMNLKIIKDNALKYLGYQGSIIDDSLNNLIDECLTEVIKYSDFKVVSQRYPLNHHPLSFNNLMIDYDDLKQLLKNCNEVMISGYTLGLQLERQLRYLAKIDMTRLTIMDALSSSYLEYLSDKYDDEIIEEKRTFRFCPGYGNVDISLNKTLANILDTNKHIGLSVTDSDLLLPQKSMIGIIGIGDNNRIKSCANCLNIQHCKFRKAGVRCYNND